MNVASLSASTKGDSVMKACRIHRFGSPEVITLEDMDKPEPGEGGSSHPDPGPPDRGTIDKSTADGDYRMSTYDKALP
jgi:hypothetical protein